MDRVLGIDVIELIGINNRTLETFKVDISNTQHLLQEERGQKIRERGITVVGESGLFTPADIAYVKEFGVKAVEVLVKKMDQLLEGIGGNGGFKDASISSQEGSVTALERGLWMMSKECRIWRFACSFVGESMHDDSTLVFACYKDGATDPTFLCLGIGMKEVNC